MKRKLLACREAFDLGFPTSTLLTEGSPNRLKTQKWGTEHA
jgi:hypothetical protein